MVHVWTPRTRFNYFPWIEGLVVIDIFIFFSHLLLVIAFPLKYSDVEGMASQMLARQIERGRVVLFPSSNGATTAGIGRACD